MTIYDNSNIAESYAGRTTPLTFSFVTHVYQGAYTYFCRMMGVDKATIGKHADMFEHMVEFIGYTIYYNLTNWYAMLALFPGYKLSSRFMERMMGVEKKYTTTQHTQTSVFQKYLVSIPKTLFSGITISMRFLFLGINVKRFNQYFDRTFSRINAIDLKQLPLKDLHRLYIALDRDLLSRWRVPIANDFAVMVSAGLADMLFKKWLYSSEAYSYMRSTAHTPLASLDPGNRILNIVDEIRTNSELYAIFTSAASEEQILALLRGQHQTLVASRQIEKYLHEFGARIPNELKLESETLTEHPTNFIALVKNIVKRGMASTSPNDTRPQQDPLNVLNIPRKIFLRWLLRWASDSIVRREETRFRRTLIFGYVRRLFLTIGEKLSQQGTIQQTRDIFYLTVEEVFDSIATVPAKTEDSLSALIEQRKKQYTAWEGVSLPRRIETLKSITEIEKDLLAGHTAPSNRISNQPLRGRVASRPDNALAFSGTALTLKFFDPAANFRDKILVTSQTDPGWTIIFPSLKGIIVERGGMLSHAAIAARELNIPCIVGVEAATDRIATGTRITINLLTGEINP